MAIANDLIDGLFTKHSIHDGVHFTLGVAYLPESLERVEHTEKIARYASNACESRLSKLSGRSAPELKYTLTMALASFESVLVL
jgi:hypothetical protein